MMNVMMMNIMNLMNMMGMNMMNLSVINNLCRVEAPVTFLFAHGSYYIKHSWKEYKVLLKWVFYGDCSDDNDDDDNDGIDDICFRMPTKMTGITRVSRPCG